MRSSQDVVGPSHPSISKLLWAPFSIRPCDDRKQEKLGQVSQCPEIIIPDPSFPSVPTSQSIPSSGLRFFHTTGEHSNPCFALLTRLHPALNWQLCCCGAYRTIPMTTIQWRQPRRLMIFLSPLTFRLFGSGTSSWNLR